MELTEEQLRFFAQNGYVHVPSAVCPEQVAAVLSVIDAAYIAREYDVNKNNRRVTQQLGSFGAGELEFNNPLYLQCLHRTTSLNDTTSDDCTTHNCNLVVCDNLNSCIKIYSCDGEYMETIGSIKTGDQILKHPAGIQVVSNNDLMICDRSNTRIVVYSFIDKSFTVLLTCEDLREKTPICVGKTPGYNGNLLVSVEGWRGPVKFYTCQNTG